MSSLESILIYDSKARHDRRLVLSKDGSYTLYSEEFDESYHSTKDGALNESFEKHVKPAMRLKQEKNELTILDICFGLGYNSFATIAYILERGIRSKVHIVSPEFDEDLIHSLGTFEYPAEFGNIKHIIDTVSSDLQYEDEQFKIEILLGDARETISMIEEKVDIIYQDAFSPAHNPLLWTREWFGDVRAICHEDAVLTTYSTSAAVRLSLYENGFYVFIHRGERTRYSTIASLIMLEDFEYIDMELKKIRNTEARSLRDSTYVSF